MRKNLVQCSAQPPGRIADMVQYITMRKVAVRSLALFAACALAAHGEPIIRQPLPLSPYADTEVSTNIPFNAVRSDARDVVIAFTAEGMSSNSCQIAFGRDADGDGVLSPAETETVYGWQAGRGFIENVVGWERIEEDCPQGNATSCVFSVRMRMSGDSSPRRFSATDGTNGAVFADLSASHPAWLYRPEWNLARVTRRGTGLPVEILRCDIAYRRFHISFR